MQQRTVQSYWVSLYHDFLTQNDPAKLHALLAPLEDAIIERMQELRSSDNGHAERIAIKNALGRILVIKTTKLGCPPLS